MPKTGYVTKLNGKPLTMWLTPFRSASGTTLGRQQQAGNTGNFRNCCGRKSFRGWND